MQIQPMSINHTPTSAKKEPDFTRILMTRLPEIFKLSDYIRQQIPAAAHECDFEFGRMKLGKDRAGTSKNEEYDLTFIKGKMQYKVPNEWIYPMIGALRANILFNEEKGILEWIVPVMSVINDCIVDWAEILVSAHRDRRIMPDMIVTDRVVFQDCHRVVVKYVNRRFNT